MTYFKQYHILQGWRKHTHTHTHSHEQQRIRIKLQIRPRGVLILKIMLGENILRQARDQKRSSPGPNLIKL